MKPASTAATAKTPVRDPRYLALRNFAVSISVFNIIGYSVLGFEQPWLWPVLAVLTGYGTELALELVSAWSYRRPPRFTGGGPRGFLVFLLPSHITALAVNMLLYVNNRLFAMLFAVFVGVAGKHVLQAPVAGRMRHFMNPSNFGIVVALLCFSEWISIAPPYEFTENANTLFRVFIPLVLVTSGTVINGVLTKRIPLILGWVGGFVIQALLRHWIWHVALMGALAPMTGVAFALYTNYMITDPGTTPVKPRNQFMFGSAVATAYGVLMLCNVVYTLFFATVVVCGLRGAGLWGIHLLRRRQAGATGSGTPGAPLGERPGSETVAA
jgi:hypothetical protein